jgi:hypothetical protein
MVRNDAGEVAIAYYQTIPHVVLVGNAEYAFAVRANICFSWVKSEHVPQLLGKSKSCCGGSRHKIYRYANEDDVRRWTRGGGR